MRSKIIKIFILLISLVFFTDDIDVDVMLAPILNNVFHTSFHAINRDLVENTTEHQQYRSTVRTCASTSIVAVDQDDPTTLETAFPAIGAIAKLPETTATIVPTDAGHISVSYLSLHTLLI